MDLADLDQRIRHLERELAAARWRTRIACGAALAGALVFACRSKDDKPPILELGNIKLDGLAGTITTKSNGGQIVISPDDGFVFSTKTGYFAPGEDPKFANYSLGPSGLQLRSGEGAFAELTALGGQAHINLRRGDPGTGPAVELAVASDVARGMWSVTSNREAGFNVGDAGASMLLNDGGPSVVALAKREGGVAAVMSWVDHVGVQLHVGNGKGEIGPIKEP